MKVSIEQSGCISCGFCVGSCPDIFAFGDDEKAVVVKQPDASLEEEARNCADGCPVSVVYIEE